VALGGVFGSEILTPDDVLTALSLPPLLAAVWTLSGRLAAVVSALALSLFAVVLVEEAPNRLTILSIGVAGVVLAVVVRAYAASLDEVLQTARRGHAGRSILPTLAATSARLRGLDSLTRREVEVARLASHGYMASEIAASLQISERTVESHLAHVYTKLGVTSRRELIRMSGLSGKIDQ
jgi:DNA-binding NarL/FixJ family response regulator